MESKGDANMNAVPERNENNAVEFNPPKVDPIPKAKHNLLKM